MLRHDSVQNDCVGLRIEVPNTVTHQNDLHTFHIDGSGARIDVHDVREKVDWQNDHIGRGDV